MNRNGRPRKPVDEDKLARALEQWRAGNWSFSRAARHAGISREMLRTRAPECADEADYRRAEALRRYYELPRPRPPGLLAMLRSIPIGGPPS